MLLQEVFDHLKFGELRQLNFGGFDAPIEIDASNYAEVVSHINLALLDLYTRFPIKESEHVLETAVGQTLYPLPTDLLRISAVFDSQGSELPLDDDHIHRSVYTASYNQVQVPFATGDETLHVIYRCKPERILVPGTPELLDLTQEIPLPDSLLEALLLYVEYRAQKSRNSESGAQLAMAAKQNYETYCAQTEARNVLNNGTSSTSIKPELGGWV